MADSNKRKRKDIIKQSKIYGNIKKESNSWDDREELGEDFLLKSKIIKIKIYSGLNGILGLTLTFKNLINNEIREIEHKGKNAHNDIKTVGINENEYFVNFHIKIPDFKGYISYLGFSTNKNNRVIIGTCEGANKIIKSNGGENIIIGTYGCYRNELDGIGIYYITRKDFLMMKLYGYFIVRYFIKKKDNFKETWNNKYKKIKIDYQYLWKTLNLPDKMYYGIIKYLI